MLKLLTDSVYNFNKMFLGSAHLGLLIAVVLEDNLTRIVQTKPITQGHPERHWFPIKSGSSQSSL